MKDIVREEGEALIAEKKGKKFSCNEVCGDEGFRSICGHNPPSCCGVEGTVGEVFSAVCRQTALLRLRPPPLLRKRNHRGTHRDWCPSYITDRMKCRRAQYLAMPDTSVFRLKFAELRDEIEPLCEPACTSCTAATGEGLLARCRAI